MLIRGSCHCQNLRFSLTWEPDPAEIPARACTCSFCVKHGAVWTSHPGGTLEVDVRDPERVSAYAFATQTAAFQVCRECGVAVLVTSEIDGDLYAVVNVKTFDDVDPSLLRHSAVSLDGESERERLARRKRGWIRDVKLVRSA